MTLWYSWTLKDPAPFLDSMEYDIKSIFVTSFNGISNWWNVVLCKKHSCSIIQGLQLESTLQEKSLRNISLLLSSSAEYWTFKTCKCPGYKIASCINVAVKFTSLKAALVKYLWIHVVVTMKKLHCQLNLSPWLFPLLVFPHWIVFHEIQSMSLTLL